MRAARYSAQQEAARRAAADALANKQVTSQQQQQQQQQQHGLPLAAAKLHVAMPKGGAAFPPATPTPPPLGR